MKNSLILSVFLLFLFSAICCGQRGSSNKGTRSAMDVPDNPQAVGDAGVAWYTTWETGLAEARRSNRPIFFMSAATTCSGISGVFWPGYTKTQNSLFANEDFIEASRKFVCIRIETYENKESEEKVRALLNGAFANTAFCLFDPEGEERLSRAGRGPSMGLGGRGERGERGGRGGRGEQASGDAGVIQRMDQIAAEYSPKGQKEDVTLQDFNSFRQALNVASADQRLLVFLNAENSNRQRVEAELKQVFADSEVVGKFHLKLKDGTMDENWAKVVQGATDKPGILIIRSGTFGLEGEVVGQLPISSDAKKIKSAMLNANKTFAAREDRKTYRDHVTSGRRQGIYFENEIPYGEDRDGDGKIDNQRRGRRQ